MVEDVEEFGAELHGHTLADLRVLEEPEVAARDVVALQIVSGDVAVRSTETLRSLFGVDYKAHVFWSDGHKRSRVVQSVEREVSGGRSRARSHVVDGDGSCGSVRIAQERTQRFEARERKVRVRAAEEELRRSKPLARTSEIRPRKLITAEEFAH